MTTNVTVDMEGALNDEISQHTEVEQSDENMFISFDDGSNRTGDSVEIVNRTNTGSESKEGCFQTLPRGLLHHQNQQDLQQHQQNTELLQPQQPQQIQQNPQQQHKLPLPDASVAPKPVSRRGKRHQCNYCDYSTDRIGDIKKHIPIHTGETPFECTECDFRCKRKHHLQAHMKIHERMYKDV